MLTIFHFWLHQKQQKTSNLWFFFTIFLWYFVVSNKQKFILFIWFLIQWFYVFDRTSIVWYIKVVRTQLHCISFTSIYLQSRWFILISYWLKQHTKHFKPDIIYSFFFYVNRVKIPIPFFIINLNRIYILSIKASIH